MADYKVPIVDSTSRDYRAIRDTLINLIPFFTPEWTNFNASDPGIVILELVAALGDMLNFNMDQIARDGGWNTAISRSALLAQAELINYKVRGPSSSTTSLVFSLQSTLPTSVTIPAGTRAKTEGSNAVTFETTADLTIPAGALGDEINTQTNSFIYAVPAKEGETRTETFAPSDGTEFQQRTFTSTRIAEASVVIYVDEGSGEVMWTEVSSFARSGPDDLHYTRNIDASDNVSILFGDNGQGKIPFATATIRGEYRELSEDRGGTRIYGNVAAETVTVLDSSILYGGTVLPVQVTNIERSSGGEPRQSDDEIKRLGPLSIAAMERAVTANDYVYFAEQYPGVARAGAFDSDVCAEVQVIVVPEGGGDPSTALLADVLTELSTRKPLGTVVTARGPIYVDTDLVGFVAVEPGRDIAPVRAAVELALANYFDLTDGEVLVGQAVEMYPLLNTIGEQDGVHSMNITRFTRVPYAELDVWSGNGTITNIGVSSSTVAEMWSIYFTSVTEFTVTGSVSGLQSQTGSVGTAYTSQKGEITFTIVAGTTPQQVGDTARILVSNLMGTIDMQYYEFPVLTSIEDLTFISATQ